jgi:serine/threonine-protein kinase
VPILTHEERVGTLLAEKYRLEAILGRGGMATVFGGRHEWTGRRVAVKVLNHEFSSDPVMAERFLREARTSAELKHPNVVDVLDMGRAEDGSVYLVLERLDGSDLADILASGTLSPETTFTLLAPVMRALAYAHKKGVVHRDLKPENIFVHEDAEGQAVPKVLDFGIAKILDDAGTSMTRTGMLLGTPDYMSPEQARALPDIGPATDVWSMGVVWWQCLSGQLPFCEQSPSALVITIATTRAPSIATVAPSLHPALVAAIDRALESDRAVRYPDMRAFLDALVKAAAQAGVAVGERTSIDASRLAHVPRSSTSIGDAPTSISQSMGGLERTNVIDDAVPLAPRPSVADDDRTRTKMSWAGSRKTSVNEPRARRTSVVIAGGIVVVAALTVATLALFHRGASRNETSAAVTDTNASTHATTSAPTATTTPAPTVEPAATTTAPVPSANPPAPPPNALAPSAAHVAPAPSTVANSSPHARPAATTQTAGTHPLVVVPLVPTATTPTPASLAPTTPPVVIAPAAAPAPAAVAPTEHSARHGSPSSATGTTPRGANAPLTDYE